MLLSTLSRQDIPVLQDRLKDHSRKSQVHRPSACPCGEPQELASPRGPFCPQPLSWLQQYQVCLDPLATVSCQSPKAFPVPHRLDNHRPVMPTCNRPDHPLFLNPAGMRFLHVPMEYPHSAGSCASFLSADKSITSERSNALSSILNACFPGPMTPGHTWYHLQLPGRLRQAFRPPLRAFPLTTQATVPLVSLIFAPFESGGEKKKSRGFTWGQNRGDMGLQRRKWPEIRL